MNELLRRRPHGSLIHLFSVGRKKRDGSIYTRLLYKSVTCHHSKTDTHFPHGCANPQHVDRNGHKDNGRKKGEIDAI